MKTEKRCDNCKYSKISATEDMVICKKSIRFVKKYGSVRYKLCSYDNNCRKWESKETEEN